MLEDNKRKQQEQAEAEKKLKQDKLEKERQ